MARLEERLELLENKVKRINELPTSATLPSGGKIAVNASVNGEYIDYAVDPLNIPSDFSWNYDYLNLTGTNASNDIFTRIKEALNTRTAVNITKPTKYVVTYSAGYIYIREEWLHDLGAGLFGSGATQFLGGVNNPNITLVNTTKIDTAGDTDDGATVTSIATGINASSLEFDTSERRIFRRTIGGELKTFYYFKTNPFIGGTQPDVADADFYEITPDGTTPVGSNTPETENIGIGNGGTITGSNTRYTYILGGNNNSINASNSDLGEADGVAILSGLANSIKGDFDGDIIGSLIAGGQENILDGYWNFIGGGKGNQIDADIVNYCVIAGGNRNLITGEQAFLSFIGGGRDNVISAQNGNRNVIVGGSDNLISGTNASRNFIGGGEENNITGLNAYYAFIGSGQRNQITGQTSGHSFIGGGVDNQITGSTSTYSFLGGGQLNGINASQSQHSVLVGGRQNTISNNAQYSVIVGGYLNDLNGQRSFIGGGYNHQMDCTSGTQNVIVGGNGNKMLSTIIQNSFIGGGFDNEIGTNGSGTVLQAVSILGGEDNVVVGSRASILGGLGLRANSYMEVVKGTYNDSSNPDGIGTPSKTVYVAGQIAESLGIGTDDANRANAYVWLKNGKQIRYETPVYADNAAALAASELVGTIYRTATGQLMQVY